MDIEVTGTFKTRFILNEISELSPEIKSNINKRIHHSGIEDTKPRRLMTLGITAVLLIAFVTLVLNGYLLSSFSNEFAKFSAFIGLLITNSFMPMVIYNRITTVN